MLDFQINNQLAEEKQKSSTNRMGYRLLMNKNESLKLDTFQGALFSNLIAGQLMKKS